MNPNVFCERCGRTHVRKLPNVPALCPCGRLLEPQTRVEFFEKKQEHLAKLNLFLELNPKTLFLKGSPK